MAMGKKTFVAIIAVSLIFSLSVIEMIAINAAKANPIPSEQISPPPIIIQSPSNTTYNQNDILLNFTIVGASEYFPMTYKLSDIHYVIDGKFVHFSLGKSLTTDQYATNLTGLDKGKHILTIYADGVGMYYVSPSQPSQYTISSVQTVAFTVTKNLPTLVVTINSPLNQTYTTDSVKVNVSAYDISKAIVGMSYVMDIYYEPYWVGSVTFYSNEPKFVSDGVNFSHEGNGTTTMTNLVNGQHHMILTIREWMMDYSDTTFDVYFTVQKPAQESTVSPSVSPTLSPSPSPVPTSTLALTASLSESASALNFGNRISFTVSVEGGNAPFTYTWYIDGELVENGTSPYYATDSQAVGSHHVYVEVKDADNNTAKTLSPEFNVLPSLTAMPSSSVSPTGQPSTEPSLTANPTPTSENSNSSLILEIAGVIVIAIVVVGLLVYLSKRRGKKQ